MSIASFVGLLLALSSTGSSPSLPAGELAIYSESAPHRGQLRLVDLETLESSETVESRPIGRSGSRPDHYPSWSPDGKWLAFESYREGGWHVWITRPDGEDARRLSRLPGHDTRNYEFDPSISPDGQLAVFVRGFDLYTVSLSDPGAIERLHPETKDLAETAPAISPDGSWVAFSGYHFPSKTQHLYLLAIDGTDLRQVTEGKGTDLAPQWSPDGKTLLYYSDRDGSLELWELPLDGSAPHRLLSPQQVAEAGFETTATVDPWDNDWGATLQYRASYSPDGAWVAFSREIDGDREIFVVRRDGSGVKRVTHRKGVDGMPAWRPRRLNASTTPSPP